VQYHWVDVEAQALTGEHCQNARLIPFVTGSEPEMHTGCEGDFGRQIRGWFEGLFK